MTTNHPTAWDRAVITSEESGSIDRPLQALGWQRPNVIELDRDRLVWTWILSAENMRTALAVRRPSGGMLDSFVMLADGPPERVRDYARRWGVLGICEHNLPRSHKPDVYPLPAQQNLAFERGLSLEPASPSDWGCRPMRCETDGDPYDEYWFWEPISVWRRFAGQARTVLNMVAAIHEGKAANPKDVEAAHASYAKLGWTPSSPDLTRLVVTQCIDEWLLLARVRPVLTWHDGAAATITLGDGELFGALGVQLAMRAARTDGLASCSACGIAYTPTRRPRSDQRRYCQSEACQKAKQRDASRDRYQRQKRIATIESNVDDT